MGKGGKIKRGVTVFVIIFLFILILQTITTLSSNADIPFNANIIDSLKPTFGKGGGTVPITTIKLTEQASNYNMKPGRLKFEFDEKFYAIQVRRVKQDYVEFLVMTLDMNKLDDITAYTLDDFFVLKPNEKKEIDLNKDGEIIVIVQILQNLIL